MSDSMIFCHGDCDGIIAGALALAANPGARIWLTNPVNLDNDLRRIDYKLDRIVITDIALNERTMKDTFKEMERLRKKGTEIIYIDHHPLPNNISKKDIPVDVVVRKKKGSSSELTYLHFEKKLTWEHKILAAIGAVGDYETETMFAKEVTRDYDARSIAFQAGIITHALGEIPMSDDLLMKKSMIERFALGVFPNELNNLVEKALRGSMVEKSVRVYVHQNAKAKENLAFILDIPTGGGFNGKGALFAATAKDKSVGVCGNSIGDRISMSIRRRDERIDLNKAAKAAAKEIKGHGGGHVAAAGATIEEDQWDQFLTFLDFEIKKQLG